MRMFGLYSFAAFRTCLTFFFAQLPLIGLLFLAMLHIKAYYVRKDWPALNW